MNPNVVLKLKLSKSLMMALVGLSVVVGGCQQDPFANKSDAIKQGVPPELDRGPVVPKPIPSDALRISSDSEVYNFKETFVGELTVAGRVLQGVPDFILSIDNMDEFPGATFDAKTGAFKWTPPKDSTGGAYGVPKSLRVRLEATPVAGGAKLATTKDILIYVTRAEGDPEILNVDDLKTLPTREGEIRKFDVTLTDPDGSDVDGARPRLIAIPSVRGIADVAGLVYMDESTAAKPNPVFDIASKTWKFSMVLDLRTRTNQRGRDFTDRQATFKFALQAISRYGGTAIKPVDADIITDVLPPQVTWGDAIEIVGGVENSIQFTAFDPYAEGQIRVEFVTRVDQLPGAAVAFCNQGTRAGDMICTLSWKPLPVTAKTDVEIKFNVRNSSRVVGDTKFVESSFSRTVTVKPGAVVPPPANPPPPSPPAHARRTASAKIVKTATAKKKV